MAEDGQISPFPNAHYVLGPLDDKGLLKVISSIPLPPGQLTLQSDSLMSLSPG